MTSMLSRIIGEIANVADPTLRLATAVDKSSLASARKALKKGADPNHRDSEGRTLLMVAAFNRNLDLVKLLAEAGADLNVVSEFGNTAMDVASETGDTDIIFYLLGHGAERAEKITAGRAASRPEAAPDSTPAPADPADRPREVDRPPPSETRPEPVETADTDGRDDSNRATTPPADAAASDSADERIQAAESRAAAEERLRAEIAGRRRAEADLEALRKRDDGAETDQAGLLEAEIEARKAVEKELAAQRDEVEALTKEFEQQLDKELAEFETAETELADQRDRFRDMASSYREQLEQETEQRQKLEDELETLKRKRALAAKSKMAPARKNKGTINPALVLAMFALAIGVAWVLTIDGVPFLSQFTQMPETDDTPLAPSDEPDENIAEAQRILTYLGYKPGPADGVPGNRTRAALRAFQADVGLAQTGEVNQTVLARLKAAAHRQRSR